MRWLVALVLVAACAPSADDADADMRTRCSALDCISPVLCEEDGCWCYLDHAVIAGCTSLCGECSAVLECNPTTGRCWCVEDDAGGGTDANGCEQGRSASVGRTRPGL